MITSMIEVEKTKATLFFKLEQKVQCPKRTYLITSFVYNDMHHGAIPCTYVLPLSSMGA